MSEGLGSVLGPRGKSSKGTGNPANVSADPSPNVFSKFSTCLCLRRQVQFQGTWEIQHSHDATGARLVAEFPRIGVAIIFTGSRPLVDPLLLQRNLQPLPGQSLRR